MKTAFDITVEALRDKGLSSDEILQILSKLSMWTSTVCLSQEIFNPKENNSKNLSDIDKENKIRDLFLEIGVPRNIRGYRYLVKAVMIYDKDPEKPITKCIYPAVADAFNTTEGKVSRAIRHAIENVWDRNDMEVLRRIFGNTISRYKDKPTNSEFIAICAEWIHRI